MCHSKKKAPNIFVRKADFGRRVFFKLSELLNELL
jgi:hypothetical protein